MSRTWSDEQLSAFLDGELAAGETEALARDIEADEELAARLERLSGANRAYVAAIGSIDEHPPSAGLKAVMAAPPTAKIIPFRPKAISAFVMEHRAIAAALVVAAAVWSVFSTTRPSSEVMTDSQGYVAAASPLHRVLEETPSSVLVKLPGGLKATPRLTFATASGDFCRQYRLESATSGSEAIACRDDGRWRVEVAVFGAPGANPGDYQTAAGSASQTLDAFIDRAIDGEPLNAEQETAAIERAWRQDGR
jgi:negative regulator of sigma E activity